MSSQRLPTAQTIKTCTCVYIITFKRTTVCISILSWNEAALPHHTQRRIRFKRNTSMLAVMYKRMHVYVLDGIQKRRARHKSSFLLSVLRILLVEMSRLKYVYEIR